MAKFLTEKELYPEVRKRSKQTKDIFWVCSPFLGSSAHHVFSEEIIKNPPRDSRFIFRLEKKLVERGVIDPYEIEYLMEHIKDCQIRSNEEFHSKLYLFDDSAIVTSANLSKRAFAKNIEAGVILTGKQVRKVKKYFDGLWLKSNPITNLEDYKNAWEISQLNKKADKEQSKKRIKPHTTISPWSGVTAKKWFISITGDLSSLGEKMIFAETKWDNDHTIIATLKIGTYNGLKKEDIVYCQYTDVNDYYLEKGLVVDKQEVPTKTDGRYHLIFRSIFKKKAPERYVKQYLKELGLENQEEVLLSNGQAQKLEQLLRVDKTVIKARSKHFD